MFPGHTLRVGDPVFFAARVAAAGLSFAQQRHVGGLAALLELGELLGVVDLEAQVVHAGLGAAGGDGEVHPGVFQHPLGVVGLSHGGFRAEQGVVEGDAFG